MGVHDYHEGLEGYSPRQLLVDGCGECEARGADVVLALSHLDRPSYARAWARAALRNRGQLRDGSRAEAELLRTLGAILNRGGIPGTEAALEEALELLEAEEA